MCAITGYVSKISYNEEIIESMRDSMTYRGPDDSGCYLGEDSGKQIALAHRRLAIRDLSSGGAQPMMSDKEDVVLVYNGEIYNADEIKKELASKGHAFHSTSDTEILLHSYLEWGIDSVCKLNGMFAYAIYDKKLSKLFLVRDRMGEKPLYYTFVNNGIAFASEMKALYKYPGFEKEIDQSVLSSYLWQMYIPAPKSICKNTFKLMSGHILIYDIQAEEVSDKQYWSLDDFYCEYDDTQRDWEGVIEKLLTESVKKRMISDVPVGVFLSGGIDSSLIAALSAKVSDKGINTYSIGFEEEQYDESKYAKRIAEHIGTNHHEKICSIKDAQKIIMTLPEVYSEPMADNSQLPMLLLSKFAKEDVTVALSGDGGDELFYGYPSYKQVIRNKRLCGLGKVLRPLGELSNILKPYGNNTWRIDKVVACREKQGWFSQDLFASSHIRETLFKEKTNTYHDVCRNLMQKGSVEEQMLNLGLKNDLQEDMITKVDRATMFFSLEARAPFLDHNVVELAQKMRPELKCYQGVFKYPLKKILNNYVPNELIDRPKKGFGVPINEWLHSDFDEILKDYLSYDFIVKQGIFDANQIKHFYKAFKEKPIPALDRIAWCLLVFQLWWCEYHGQVIG